MRSSLLIVAIHLGVINCSPTAISDLTDANLLDAPTTDARDATPVLHAGTVYAHTGGELYELDVDTLTTSLIGEFAGVFTSILDIAVNASGEIIGASNTHLYRIDADTGHATELVRYRQQNDELPQFNGLSFLLGDDNRETLLGVNTFGQVYEIDIATGARTLRGLYGLTDDGTTITSSGDLVAVRGLGIYATVRAGEGGDWLAVIDPQTFSATLIAELDHASLWGIGFWGDTLYGFSSTGKLLAIDPANGDTTVIEEFPTSWYGAGVITTALVIE